MLCPCGSAALFSDCCQPFIQSFNESIKQNLIHPKVSPQTAEQLMRSRFSAYATKNAAYIYTTYADKSKTQQSLSDIEQWANESYWLALEVHESNGDSVKFSAYYLVENTLCCLTEKSKFIIEQGLWRYLDGEINSHEELFQVKRNDICPCNSYPTAFSVKKGKKFKHCCGR